MIRHFILKPHASDSSHDYQPPGVLNVSLAIMLLIGWLTFLWWADQQAHWGAKIAIGFLFAFSGLTIYTLLHEAWHQVLHANQSVNDILGTLLAAAYGGPFTFLKYTHQGHHQRNRSVEESFDIYYSEEERARRTIFFYFTYLGGFWLAVPLTSLVFIFAPSLLHGWLARRDPSVGAMLRGIPQRQFRRIRLEALGVFAFHGALVITLGLHWSTWVLLYGMFGVCWSSQNYLGHAGAPLDVQEGAHNLRANPVFEKLLLHFNWHLAHHQNPEIPWLYLPQFNDPRRKRPGYLQSYIKFWAGPRPAPREKEDQ